MTVEAHFSHLPRETLACRSNECGSYSGTSEDVDYASEYGKCLRPELLQQKYGDVLSSKYRIPLYAIESDFILFYFFKSYPIHTINYVLTRYVPP